MNPAGLSLTPTINNQVILNDQHAKVQIRFFFQIFLQGDLLFIE